MSHSKECWWYLAQCSNGVEQQLLVPDVALDQGLEILAVIPPELACTFNLRRRTYRVKRAILALFRGAFSQAEAHRQAQELLLLYLC